MYFFLNRDKSFWKITFFKNKRNTFDMLHAATFIFRKEIYFTEIRRDGNGKEEKNWGIIIISFLVLKTLLKM